MNFIQSIHPAKPLRYLKWFDILIITVLMFGEFIIRSTQQFMESLSPSTLASVAETTTNVASDGAAYSGNFTFQLIMLGITFLYLLIRNYDFKQLPIRFTWSVLVWIPLIFAVVGIIGDIVTTLSGEYNYFNPQLIPFIDPMEIIRKFMALTPMEQPAQPVEHGILFGRAALWRERAALVARETAREILADVAVGHGLRAVHEHLRAVIELRNAVDGEQQSQHLLQGQRVLSLSQEAVGVVVFDESHHA